MIEWHDREMARLRRQVDPSVVEQLVLRTLEGELTGRKRIVLFEEKVRTEFLSQVEALMRAYHETFVNQEAEAAFRTIQQNGGSAHWTRGQQIHLTDGCPFVDPSQCPFSRAEWVNKSSFQNQHMRRRMPRLKQPLRLEQLAYEQFIQAKEEHIKALNLRLYSLRLA
jgi:hypothetical protein